MHIYSLNNYLPSAYCVQSTVLGTEVATKMRGDIYCLMRDTTHKQTIASGIKVKKYGMNRIEKLSCRSLLFLTAMIR